MSVGKQQASATLVTPWRIASSPRSCARSIARGSPPLSLSHPVILHCCRLAGDDDAGGEARGVVLFQLFQRTR